MGRAYHRGRREVNQKAKPRKMNPAARGRRRASSPSARIFAGEFMPGSGSRRPGASALFGGWPRHLERAVVVLGLVGRKEIGGARPAFILIKAARVPAEVRLAVEFESVLRRSHFEPYGITKAHDPQIFGAILG